MTQSLPSYTAAQVRAAEEPVLAAGVPLMLYAARALAEVAAIELAEPGAIAAMTDDGVSGLPATDGALVGRVLVLAGSGDNGGDALYAAAALRQWLPLRAAQPDPPADRLDIDVVCTGDRVHEQALAAALAAGVRRVDLDQVWADAAAYDLVLDGILGIGTTGQPQLRGAARDAVEALLPHVRDGRPRVIAVDVPSGLHPDDGTTADEFVLPASVTVTFGGPKAGLGVVRGPGLSGAIVWVDFDLPLGTDPAGIVDVALVLAGLPADGDPPASPAADS